MPIVQYVNTRQKINVTRNMPTPKRITELSKWLRGAQTAVPHIPRQIAESEASADRSTFGDGWFVVNTDVDIKWIRFNLENRIGETAQIVINRQSNPLGI